MHVNLNSIRTIIIQPKQHPEISAIQKNLSLLAPFFSVVDLVKCGLINKDIKKLALAEMQKRWVPLSSEPYQTFVDYLDSYCRQPQYSHLDGAYLAVLFSKMDLNRDVMGWNIHTSVSPLEYACMTVQDRDVPLIRLLISKQADVGREVKNGGAYNAPALHYASKRFKLKCCEVLVNAGADVNAKDSMGKTAMDLVTASKIHERLPVINFLFSKGAFRNEPHPNCCCVIS